MLLMTRKPHGLGCVLIAAWAVRARLRAQTEAAVCDFSRGDK